MVSSYNDIQLLMYIYINGYISFMIMYGKWIWFSLPHYPLISRQQIHSTTSIHWPICDLHMPSIHIITSIPYVSNAFQRQLSGISMNGGGDKYVWTCNQSHKALMGLRRRRRLKKYFQEAFDICPRFSACTGMISFSALIYSSAHSFQIHSFARITFRYPFCEFWYAKTF